jgi:hypothetical protein
MDEQTAEKFAELLGKCAATGDSRELVKQAGLPEILLASLAGAGVGGAAGYFGTEKEKNKARNAAYGALTGGLGAGGLQTAYHYLGNSQSPKIDGAASGTGNTINKALTGAFNTVTLPFQSLAAASGLGFANLPLGSKSIATRAADSAVGLYDRITGKSVNTGSLATALTEGKIKSLRGGKGAIDPARILQSIIDANPKNPVVKKLQLRGQFANDPAIAQQQVAQLNSLTKPPQQLPGDFLTQLQKAHKGPRGRVMAGRAGRVGGNLAGIAGGLGTEYVLNTLYNLLQGKADK